MFDLLNEQTGVLAEPVLSTEIIAMQTDTEFIDKMEEQFAIIKGYNQDKRFIFTSKKYWLDNNVVPDAYAEIDRIIFERFGIPAQHRHAENIGAAIYPMLKEVDTVVDQDGADGVREVKKYIKSMISDGGKTFEGKNSLNQLLKSSKALHDKYKKSGVYINLHDAKIVGLDKKDIVIMAGDPHTLFKKFDLTPREAVAVTLHEIGHAFTHIEYTNRSVMTTSVLIDSLKEKVVNAKDNESKLEGFRQVYEDATGDVYGDKSVPVATIKMLKHMTTVLATDVNTSKHSATDSEQLADQFSGRFGLGIELSDGLNKLGVSGDNILKAIGVSVNNAKILMLVAGVIGLATVPMAGVSIGVILLTGAFNVVSEYMMGLTYDTDPRRQKRIRNESVRRLNTLDLSKEEKKKLISDIDKTATRTRNIIQYLNIETLYQKFLIKLIPGLSKRADTKELLERLEDMQANELHVAKSRLDTLVTEAREELSTEMIGFQPNDGAVAAMVKQAEIIKAIAEDAYNSRTSSKRMYKDSKISGAYKAIAALIKDRFGMNVVYLPDDYVGNAIYTLGTLNKGGLSDYRGFLESLQKYFAKRSPTSKKEDVEIGSDDMYYYIKESIENLDKALQTDGILVDTVNAKLIGMPKEHVFYMVADPRIMFNILDLTPEEYVATIMHEIGHGFTHIEYGLRSVQTTSVLIDSLKENYLEKGKSNKEVILALYEDIGGDQDLTNMSTAVQYMTVLKGIAASLSDINNTAHSGTDSEQLADQFANRFGLGTHLVTSLDKFHTAGIPMLGIYNSEVVLIPLIVVISIMFPLFGIAWAIGSITSIMIAVLSTHDDTGDTYDIDSRRTKRIRNDMIKQLRGSSLPKPAIKQLLQDLDMTYDIIEEYSKVESEGKYHKKLVTVISRFFNTKTQSSRDIKMLEELMEDMQANELHVATKRLENL